MTFRVIDRETGREVSESVKDEIARKNGLMWMDIDQFYCGEDGDLLLMDDCGNYAICDSERFIVEVLDGDSEECIRNQ